MAYYRKETFLEGVTHYGLMSVLCKCNRDHSGEIDRVSVSLLYREQPVSGDNANRLLAEERKRARTREVEEKELVAGGVESVRGMRWLRARINIISCLLTES